VPLLVLTGILTSSAVRARTEAETARRDREAIELAAPLASLAQMVGPSRELAAYQVVSVQGDGDLGAVFSGPLPAFDQLAGERAREVRTEVDAAFAALGDHDHVLTDPTPVWVAVGELARLEAQVAAAELDDLDTVRRRYDDVGAVLVAAVGELLGGTDSTEATPVLALVDAGDAVGVEATVVFLGLMGAEVGDELLEVWRHSVVTQELRLGDLARTAPGLVVGEPSSAADPAEVARSGYGGWETYRARFERIATVGSVEPSIPILVSAGAAIRELVSAYQAAQATLLDALVAAADDREAAAEADLRRALLVAAVAVAVTGAVTVLVTRSLARPLSALARRARRLGEGDLGTAEPVAVSGRDEVATLAATFEEMERNLLLIGAQTEALAAGRVDAPVLAIDAPGRLGALLRTSVATLSETTRRLRDSEALSRTIVDSAPDAIVVADAAGTIISANASARELAGWPGGLVGARLEDALGIEPPPPGTRRRIEHLHRDPRGEDVPLLVSVSTATTADGGIVTVIARDIRDRKALEARLTHDATHDQLTGLLNRAGFAAAVDARLAASDEPHALLFVDLDRFKRVNDTQGHAAGDEVLREVARRILGLVRADDLVGRIGGDEFVVLGRGLRSDTARRFADRAVTALGEPFRLPTGEQAHLGASVGVACTQPDRPIDADRLLAEADLAMYAAKPGGAGKVRAFDESLQRAVAVDVRQEQALRRALTAGDVPVHFQPIVRLRDERIVGVEALLRWADPHDELANPARLVQVAESSGLIHDLGAHVLERSLRAVVDWRRHRPDLTVAVNISAHQLARGTIVPAVRRALRVTGADGPALHLEVTETQLLDDTDAAARQLAELRSLGVGISLDDFGTGFSSLTHLSTLPIDTVKIDRVFSAMVVEPGRRGPSGLAELVVAIGAILGLDVVAEGVETRDQARRLRELGCELAQGYLWSPAVPPDQVTGWLRDEAGVAVGVASA
jgi:diguanylate cyclase (GGDEF)-like protein/PAS domain S-box-containing protein